MKKLMSKLMPTFGTRRDGCFGFTLVELLVVIAIIGMLIALLLPAVQAAREAARRMTCTNHLKQLALAMHNHHDVYNRFPNALNSWWAAPAGKIPQNAGTAWTVFVTPFIEQQALYDTYITYLSNNTNYAWDACTAVTESQISILVCPSDSRAKVRTESSMRWASNSYHGCRGDIRGLMWWGLSDRGALVSGVSGGQPTNSVESVTEAVSTNQSGLRSITDGTSNTILLSEVAIADGSSGGEGPIRGATALYGGTVAGYHDSPSICLSARSGSGMVSTTYTHATYSTGNRWTHGEHHHTAFHTMLAPNLPTCTRSGGDWSMVTASSHHTGGVNVALCDASVRFVTDAVDAGDPSIRPHEATGATGNSGDDYAKYAGKSLWGIWGALGTAKASESAALP